MIKFKYNNFYYELNGEFKYLVSPLNKKAFFELSKQLRSSKNHSIYLNDDKLDDKYNMIRYIELNHDFFNIGDIKKNKLIKEFLYSFFNNSFADIINTENIIKKTEDINSQIPQLEFLYNDNLKKIIDIIFTTTSHINDFFDFALLQLELIKTVSNTTLIVMEFPENYLTISEIKEILKFVKKNQLKILLFTNIPFVLVEGISELESISLLNNKENDFVSSINNYEVFLNYIEENTIYNDWDEIMARLIQITPFNIASKDKFDNLVKDIFK